MANFEERHPGYARFKDRWSEMRDHIEGTPVIKDKGQKYLPIPDGMRDPSDPEGERAAYHAYKMRAQYPEIVGPAIRSMAGVIHREDADYALPSSLESGALNLRERATLDNMTLESLHRRITRELLSVGRLGLMADTGPDGGEPYIAAYKAEDIVNWHDTDTGVDLVVLDESGDRMNRETFAWTQVTRYRVLAIEDGQYVVRVFEEGVQVEEITPQVRGGGRLTELPFVFVDTNDLTPEPDEVPLYGLAQIAGGIYRMDADYRQALFLIAQPQRWCSGVQQEQVPDVWGAGVVWVLPPHEAQAGILEFTGQGTSAQRQAMIDGFEQAAQFGARMFDRQGGQAESGEARKIRHGQETATLATIAQTGAAGLEKALRWCAEFQGADRDEVQVMVDTDFMDRTLGAQEMQAIIQAVTGRILSSQTAYELFKRGGRANPERDWEEEQDLVERDDGDLGLLGRE